MKKIIISTVLFISVFQVFSQDTLNHRKRLFYRGDRENSIATITYIGSQKTIDEGVSPLLYQGSILGVGLAYQSLRKRNLWNISGSFGTSSQYSPARNDFGYYQGYNIDINFRYLWNTDTEKKLPFTFFAGLYSNQTTRIRINENMFNAAFNYDIMWGIGGSAHISKTLNIKAFDINF